MARALITYSEPFRVYVERELKRSQARLLELLAPGVAIIEFEQPFAQLAQGWKQRPPVYLRHLAPIQSRTLRQLCLALDRRLPVQVQVRNLSWTLQPDLQERLERLARSISGAPVVARNPAQVLHVTLTDQATYGGVAPHCWTLGSWPPDVPDDPWRINRAELKLLEALDVFRIRLSPGLRALDLGASPGGWTRLLLARGVSVTAVDPHPRGMAPRVREHPALQYLPCRAEEYLASSADRFDLITCDMYLPARESARLLVQAAPLLRSRGRVLANLKLGHPRRHHALLGALSILRQAYRIPRMKQLHFNRSEVTLWMLRVCPSSQVKQHDDAERNAHHPQE